MLTHLTNSFALLVLLAAGASAHPGEDHAAEAVERAASLASMGRRSLSHCSEKLAARGVHARNVARRAALHNSLLARNAKRDLTTVLNTSHQSNLTGITPETDPSTLFAGENECILGPETTQGPYYVTGEYFRQNVTESQAGVPLYLDIQVIDTNTCEPLPNVALDFWHCNATGVYSGVAASGNGDSSDTSNLNATFLRGIQSTDSDGVVQFQSIAPGHYTGRANHIHILAHTEGTWSLLENNTITGGETTAHVGQLFFDQDLISQFEAVEPYASNTQELLENSEDNILAGEADTIDPFVEYVLLGDSIEDGIFAWISMGLNATASYSVSAAASYGENGGVANADSGMGGGGGGGGGAPSGSCGAGGAPGGNDTMSGGASMGNGSMPGGDSMGNGSMSGGPGGDCSSAATSVAGASPTADISGTAESAVSETSGASSIFSMSIPLAMMAAALRLAQL